MKIKLLFLFLSLGYIGSIYSLDQAPNKMLLRGVRDGDIKLVQEALDKGANIDAQDPHEGWSALMIAIDENKESIAKLLLDKGAKVNLQPSGNNSALSLAAMNNNTDITNLLLDKGANINIISRYGFTPLMTAVLNDNLEVARLLIDRGASLYLVNEKRENKTAVDFAKQYSSSILKLIREKIKKEIVESSSLLPELADIVSDYLACATGVVEE